MKRRRPLLVIAHLALFGFVACGGVGSEDDALGVGGGGKGGAKGGAAGKSAGGGGAAGQGASGAAATAGSGTAGSGTSGAAATAGSGAAGSSTAGNGTGGSNVGGSGGGAIAGKGGATSAGSGGSSASGTGGAATAGSGAGGSPTAGTAGTGAAGGATTCAGLPSVDDDHDGFTELEGDCNDCDPNVNPGAVDVITLDANGQPTASQADEDCDGVVLQPGQDVCDAAFKIDDADPIHAANAIEICQVATGKKWGITTASYVKMDGAAFPGGNAALGHGLLAKFGPVIPKKGQRMLALSSGAARAAGDPGYQNPSGFDKGYTNGNPPGFPIESPSCPGVKTGVEHDSVALKLGLKVPTNAKSFTFKFKFYTWEYPGYICSQYNDFFAVLMAPPPADVNQTNKNITFDSQKNPVSVNNAFLEVCSPGKYGGKTFTCPAGTGDLAGTGFEGHAATAWLQTTANVTPGGTITLTFGAFDSGDGVLDSTGLVDDFRWSATPGTGTGTIKP